MQCSNKLTVIDLFSGCGGLTDGFKKQGSFTTLAGVDWEKHPVNTLRKRLRDKWGSTNADNTIINFDIQRTDELLHGFSDKKYGGSKGLVSIVNNRPVDVVIGGPPCQAYSVANKSKAIVKQGDYRNFLFEAYIKIVTHFQPKICIFENVMGMLSAKVGGTPIVDLIREAFKKHGYEICNDIRKTAVFDTSKFGTPQKRRRVILIAVRKKSYDDYLGMIYKFYAIMRSYEQAKATTIHNCLMSLPKIYPCKKNSG